MARGRQSNEVNAGSMADIAFLLLIFFLVTTTIATDKAIQVKLPPWSEEAPDPLKLKKNNVFGILVNKDDQLLVRGEPTDVSELKERCVEFIDNPTKRADLSDSPTNAIISLKNDRGTSYDAYIQVYNEVMAAYNELWDRESQRLFNKPYSDEMPLAQKKEIKGNYPLVISEAEPTSFGDEN